MTEEEQHQYEVLRDRYTVVEWRDNSVYRTRYEETAWVDMFDAEHPPRGTIYAALSTSDPRSQGLTIRKKSVEGR